MTLIYVLEKNSIPFYIGKTSSSKSRFNSHKRDYDCEIFIIDEVDDWKFWEKHYISLFKSWGFKLENKNNGGGGPTTIKFNEQRNQKLSKSNTGKTHSEETKLKMSLYHIGHKRNLGKKHSLETKQKISRNSKGKSISNETKLKTSISMKGKKWTEEHKQKISKALLGKPKSEQHKLNMMKNRKNVIDGVKLSNSKIVIQFDLEGNFINQWASASEAKEIYKGDIHACCSGRQKTAGGFIWKYKN
jgi:hypothetical protein